MMYKSCFLFGNADTPSSVISSLKSEIKREIEKGITTFYVGHRGNFDNMAISALLHEKRHNEEMELLLLTAYHPSEYKVSLPIGFDGTFYPEGMESTPRKFAIVEANKYMVRHTDSIICHVIYPGNARKLLDYAQR